MSATGLSPTSIGGVHSYVVRMLGTSDRVHDIAMLDDRSPWGVTVPAILVPALCTCPVNSGQLRVQDCGGITTRHVRKSFKKMDEYSQVICWHPPFFSVGLAQAGLGQSLVLAVRYSSFAASSARLIWARRAFSSHSSHVMPACHSTSCMTQVLCLQSQQVMMG